MKRSTSLVHLRNSPAPSAAATNRAPSRRRFDEIGPRVWMEALEARWLLSVTMQPLGTVWLPRDASINYSTAASGPDGKVFVLTDFSVAPYNSNPPNKDRFALLAFNADGTPDTNFGGGRIDFPDGEPNVDPGGLQMLVQQDGKVLVLNEWTGPGVAATRFNPDGTVDRTFAGGRVSALTAQYHFGATPWLYTQWLTPDGKLMIANTIGDLVVYRFNVDGTPDATFGTGGVVVVPSVAPETSGWAVMDGAITTAGGGTDVYFEANALNGGVAVPLYRVRLDAGGTRVAVDRLDDRGPSPGYLRGGYIMDYWLTPLADGSAYVSPVGYDFVERLAPDGTVDPTFGTRGAVTIPGVPEFGVTPTTSGGDLIVDECDVYADVPFSRWTRLKQDGSVDPTFAAGQPVDVSSYAINPWMLRMMGVEPDGSLLFECEVLDERGIDRGIGLFRLPADGGGPSAATWIRGSATDSPLSTSAPAATGLFATAPGVDLFNPDGDRQLFDDAAAAL